MNPSLVKAIRVVRLLEYLYDSPEAMEEDMARWGVQGTHAAEHVTIRAVTVPGIEVLAEPYLLAALKALLPLAVSWGAAGCAENPVVVAARDAIAKAEGKSP